MASLVTVRLPPATAAADALCAGVEELFAEVERTCTRFDRSSSLMRANRAGESWCAVEPACLAALREAHQAYRDTAGLFDPRVLRSLAAVGYDRSFAFDAAPQRTPAATTDPATLATHAVTWEPEFDSAAGAVRIGPWPVDLGGIGKGLALRWAGAAFASLDGYFLIEAGGDCLFGGAGPTGAGWSVGVEDPAGGEAPVAVLSLADTACATTSIRLRQWSAAQAKVHHVIDPRTGAPSTSDLAAVTVVGADPARCEVLSKALFLLGTARIATAADAAGVAALWVSRCGVLAWNDAMAEHLLWRSR